MAAARWLDLLHGNSGLQVHVPVHKAAVGGLCGPSISRHGCVTSMAFYWLKQVTSPPRFKRREGGPLYLWQVCQGHITERHNNSMGTDSHTLGKCSCNWNAVQRNTTGAFFQKKMSQKCVLLPCWPILPRGSELKCV